MVLFLDSGVGGLVYHDAFRDLRPDVETACLADSKWFPYGRRNPGELQERLCVLVERIHRQRPLSAVVVACNTASVVALQALRARFSFPVVGVVPAVKPAAALTGSGAIAILATVRTAGDPYTAELTRQFARLCRVTALGLPELVHATEAHFCDTDGNHDAVRRVFREEVLPALPEDVDVVVLACTHFVRYRGLFQEILGSAVQVVDSLEGVTSRVDSLVREDGTAIPRSGEELPTLYHTGEISPGYRCLAGHYRLHRLDVPGGDP